MPAKKLLHSCRHLRYVSMSAGSQALVAYSLQKSLPGAQFSMVAEEDSADLRCEGHSFVCPPCCVKKCSLHCIVLVAFLSAAGLVVHGLKDRSKQRTCYRIHSSMLQSLTKHPFQQQSWYCNISTIVAYVVSACIFHPQQKLLWSFAGRRTVKPWPTGSLMR